MAKKQKTSENFSRTAIVPNFQPFYKPISATAMIKDTYYLLLRKDKLHSHDYMHQVMSKNLNRKSGLRREFWGILGKKINPTTKAIIRLGNAPLRIKILFLSKYNFNTFLSNKLRFKEVPDVKKPLIPAIWHRIGLTQKSFKIKKYIN